MSVETMFNREWLGTDHDVFVSYGNGSDIDQAYDDAALSDRIEYGTAGVTASLEKADPAWPRSIHDGPMHRHQAWALVLEMLPDIQPGTLHAIPVAPMKAYRHRTVNVTVTDPSLPAPAVPGSLWMFPALAEAAASMVTLDQGETAVSAALPRLGSARYKASAAAHAGPKHTMFAVVPEGEWKPLSVHTSASEARRAALTVARDKSNGPLTLEIRPVVTKADGAPLITVKREPVACRRPIRVLVASLKNEDKPLPVDGWVLFGRCQ